MLKRVEILLLLLLVPLVHSGADLPKDYTPVNTIISFLKLNVEYRPLSGSLILTRQRRSVRIVLHSSIIQTGTDIYHASGLVRSDRGEFIVTRDAADKIIRYFSAGRYQYFNNEESSKTDSREWYLNSVDVPIENDENRSDIVKELDSQKTIDIDEQQYVFTEEPEKVTINAIIIDPGHGGKDPGAVGYNSIKEKDIVLRTGLILKEMLQKEYPDKRIILTRDNDTFIPLEKRANIANYVYSKYGASLFISLHANASRSRKPYGFETWYLVGEYRRNVLKNSNTIDDADVADIINTMINDEIYAESQLLAKNIQQGLETTIGYVSKNRGIKEEVYFVIKKAIMPAVLVEIGFNTNKYEAIRLTKQAYLTKIAQGIIIGTKEFIKGYEDSVGYTK